MVRTRAQTLLVALALATLASVLVAAPAHAEEVKQQTHLVAQFNSGHTGWIKIALEVDDYDQGRAHVGIWCQNASGTKVQCGAIEFAYPSSKLNAEWWEETQSSWLPLASESLAGDLYSDPPLTLNLYTVWACGGEYSDQYRAVISDVRIQDAFGQWSGWKTRTHPTWLGSIC
jgi:hypothetical protein